MEINNITALGGTLMMLSFIVNIIVQLTKEIISLPTKLWCIIVAMSVNLSVLCVFAKTKLVHCDMVTVVFAFASSFVVAYVAMYGFDTFRELWQRFKKGENINENN